MDGAPRPLTADVCPACGGTLTDRRLKKHCDRCGALCETCCDGGCPADGQEDIIS